MDALSLSPSFAADVDQAQRYLDAGRFTTYASALRAVLAAREDPTGPHGIYGLGRCAKCGESFRITDDQAEVEAGLVHAECVGEDPLA